MALPFTLNSLRLPLRKGLGIAPLSLNWSGRNDKVSF